MMNLMLYSLQPYRGMVNFILAQLYVGAYNGNSKLANPLVNLGVAPYTEQRSTLAPAGVLM